MDRNQGFRLSPFDADIMTSECGSLVTGHAAKDEIVVLLSEDNVFVKI